MGVWRESRHDPVGNLIKFPVNDNALSTDGVVRMPFETAWKDPHLLRLTCIHAVPFYARFYDAKCQKLRREK